MAKYKVELTKPTGIRHMNVNNLTVNIGLDKAEEKEINRVSIETRNLNEELYSVEGLSAEDTSVTVTAKGVSSIIKGLESSDVTAYLDLKGFGVGVHEVEVQVEGTETRVQYVPKTKKVKIRIVRK